MNARLRDALMLRCLPGVGDVTWRRVVEQYGSVADALENADRKDLGEDAVAALYDGRAERRTDAALRSIEELGIQVLFDDHPLYPASLREAADAGVLEAHLRVAPVMLFARGDVELLRRSWIAVVGTRRMTEYGENVTHRFARFLSRCGEVVASGLARGIDAAAHQAALAAGGATAAVTGCGVDVAYPPEHVVLQDRIADRGLVLSALPPGAPPTKHQFLHRNAILAALCRGVLVVEAPATSGALSTASCVRVLGGEVAAIPGAIGRPASEGTNALIRDGATIALEEQDLVTAFGLSSPGPAPAAMQGTLRPRVPEGPGRPLWELLGEGSRHVDDLSGAAGLDTGRTLALLLELELDGRIRQLPGLRFARI